MRSKLHAIAQLFVQQVGSDLPRYTFVFPNHRAGLFFRKYLAQYVDKPIFAPHVMSINECFAELSDKQVADQLTLLLRLYSEYIRLRPNADTLDQFIYWGKMMLADFSEIDNHLVQHVDALFASVNDWHAIEERFQYLTDNQRQALARFWKEFHDSDKHHPDVEMHKRFLHTWDLLYPLYVALRDNLRHDGLAYEGMLHREVLEHWNEIPQERFRAQYVFLGFNALTASERELMLRLQEMGRADFYFDYDSPFVRDPQNKASLFMEENLRLFRSRYPIPNSDASFSQYSSSDSEASQITLISVPSTVGQVHEVNRILSEIIPTDCPDLTRTAVVLPDEQLLIPLLNAFPKSVTKINVTMGYPLRATSVYMPVAYPEQFLQPMPNDAADFIAQVRCHLLSQLHASTSEAIYQLSKVLDRLEVAITAYPQIAFTVTDMQQLLKMLTLETTIPYEGEPLDGLQVMGVLETRALDFDNIIITDFNDDLYPGRSRGNSFVPYVLRVGFDMPTPDRQNAIFAYNFYRMLSYAKNVWLIANSTADEQHSGEVSRYYYQMLWQYNMNIRQTTIAYALNSSTTQMQCPAIEKDERAVQLDHLSASALTTYLRCPKSFYYRHIEHVEEPEIDESVSVSDLTLGNVLHAIMQQLYTPYIGKNVTASIIQELLDKIQDDGYWESLAPLQDLHGDMLARNVIRSLVSNILNYDYTQAPFVFIQAEKPVKVQLPNNMTIRGTIDRLDTKAGVARVIDYKTGSTDLQYKSMADVFGVVPQKEDGSYCLRNKGKGQILQTMLYCWIMSEEYPSIAPYVYAARRLADTATVTCVHSGKQEQPILFDETMKQEFLHELTQLIDEIRNPEIPFVPCAEDHPCEYCAFISLCGRQVKN
jgi:hypothetical protein